MHQELNPLAGLDPEDAGLSLPTRRKAAVMRTTFSLATEAIASLDELSVWFRLPKGEVVRYATEVFESIEAQMSAEFDAVSWKALGGEMKARRSIAVPKDSLSTIRASAARLGVSRDEYLSRALLVASAWTKLQKERTAVRYGKALTVLDAIGSAISEAEAQLIDDLGPDDPVVSRVGLLWVIFSTLTSAIENEMQNGEPVDPDNYSQC